MKKIVIVTLTGLMVASASAMPTEGGGEHSYSFQGKATSIRTVNRNRNIPAPSAWTPPERIPSPRVTYVTRKQPTKLGGGNTFTSPSFSNPSFSNPSFASPGFASPSSSSPSFTSPSFTSPATSSPSFGGPSFSNPSTSIPGFASPSF